MIYEQSDKVAFDSMKHGPSSLQLIESYTCTCGDGVGTRPPFSISPVEDKYHRPSPIVNMPRHVPQQYAVTKSNIVSNDITVNNGKSCISGVGEGGCRHLIDCIPNNT